MTLTLLLSDRVFKTHTLVKGRYNFARSLSIFTFIKVLVEKKILLRLQTILLSENSVGIDRDISGIEFDLLRL